MRFSDRRCRSVLNVVVLGLAVLATPVTEAAKAASGPGLNILLITADDMNWDSPGCFGGRTPEITPNIDRLAAQGMRFRHAHVTIAVCTPCRSVLLTGRYPHRNGVEGFQRIRPDVPTLPGWLRDAGYRCGIIGKPLGQQEIFRWSVEYASPNSKAEHISGRDPSVYYRFAKDFFQQAATSGQPFFLMANSHDPHRAFHGSEKDRRMDKIKGREAVDPSRVYRPDEIDVPGFLPDVLDVRREVAQYYSSVRRCDDTVGAIMRALRESGQDERTLVIFLSDHGMAFPFAKTNCYLNSTRTPWIVRWPGRVKPGTVDSRHFISAIDLMPTVLDGAGVAPPEGMDGFSFLPILGGEPQAGRERVFTQFHLIHGRTPYPMRCVQDAKYGYVFNAWSNGKRQYDAEPLSGLTFIAMQEAARTDPAIAARVRMLQYRTVEEFYDLENDPDALHNLIGDPAYTKEVDRLKGRLRDWMHQTGDPALEAFENLHSPAALEAFMKAYKAKAAKEVEALKAYEIRTGYYF